MKSTFVAVLLALAVGLGALCVWQSRKMTDDQSQVASLKSELEEKTDRMRELETSKQHLSQQQSELLQQAEAQAAELNRQINAAPPPALTPSGQAGAPDGTKPEPDQAGFGKLFSKMLEDPQTKKFILEQQRMVMDQLYAPLVKQMALTPDEAGKFKDLMAETAMKSAERATSLFGGSDTNRTESLRSIAADSKAAEEKMKELLGDARYGQYKEYQQTAGERMQLNLFKQQYGSGDGALTDLQTEQLLTLMKEEKQSVAAVGQPVPGLGNDAATLEAIRSEDHSESMLQSQEEISNRVFERAKTVLSEEQLSAYAKFQTNQLQMMRMGMSMARKFMGPATPAAPSQP